MTYIDEEIHRLRQELLALRKENENLRQAIKECVENCRKIIEGDHDG